MFASHGGLRSAHRMGRVIYAHGSGATNLEAMQAYYQSLHALVAELDGGRWAVLGSSDDDTLLTPEAEQLMKAGTARLTAAGRVAVAVVLPQTAIRHLMQAQWSRVFAGAGCALGFFDDHARAHTWLEERLAEADAKAAGA